MINSGEFDGDAVPSQGLIPGGSGPSGRDQFQDAVRHCGVDIHIFTRVPDSYLMKSHCFR